MQVKLSDKNQKILNQLKERAAAGTLEGAFAGIPIEVYHHPECPGYSSTYIKAVVASCFKYAQQREHIATPEMEFGTRFHTFMQSREEFLARYAVGRYEPAKHFVSWDDFARIKVMAENVLNHPVAKPLVVGGDEERTFFSYCPVTGILRKCRPDVVNGAIISDYKSTMDACESAFTRTAKRLLYRVSAAYYLDTTNGAQKQRAFEEFKFIAVESQGLHEVAVYDIDDRSLERARSEIQVASFAIANASTGGWTGYPLYTEPLYI
jgi:hypothetical protein